MRFSDEQMIDIENVCKLVVRKEITYPEASKYLKDKYNATKCVYSYDGKAIIEFPDGKTLRFGSLNEEKKLNYFYQEDIKCKIRK